MYFKVEFQNYRLNLLFTFILSITFINATSDATASTIEIAEKIEKFQALDSLPLPDLTNDGIHENGLLYLNTVTNQLELQVVDGVSLLTINSISWPNIYANPSVHLLPDINGNSSTEVGIFGERTDGNSAGRLQLFVKDLKTWQNVRTYNWPANWDSTTPLILDDITGDSIADIAIQGRFIAGNRPQLVVRDGSTAQNAITFSYPAILDNPVFYQHNDINGDNISEITTFGRIKRNGKPQVKIANGTRANNRLGAYNFPNKWRDVQWLELDDMDNDGINEWGLFGITTADDRPQLVVKNGISPRGIIRIYAWPSLENPTFTSIPDMNGDGVDEVAVGGLRPNGRYQLQIKDGADRSAVLANHNEKFAFSTVTYHVLPDLTADGISEIGFMGSDVNGNYIIAVRDGLANGGALAEYNLGPFWASTPSIRNLQDINEDGLNEIIIQGVYLQQSKIQMWAIADSDADGFPDTADRFPNDENEWLDTDNDQVGNNADTDDDNDGILDVNDGYPLISISGFIDTDNDGIPDDCNSLCFALGMTADEDDNGNGIPDAEEGPPVLKGQFLGVPISGISYVINGITEPLNDNAEFSYVDGDNVTFKLGGVVLGSKLASAEVSSINLVPEATSKKHFSVIQLNRFLFGLDNDCDASNGYAIASETLAALESVSLNLATNTRNLDDISELELVLESIECTNAWPESILAQTLYTERLHQDYARSISSIATYTPEGESEPTIIYDDNGSMLQIIGSEEDAELFRILLGDTDELYSISIGLDGLPRAIYSTTGEFILMRNFTGNTVDILVGTEQTQANEESLDIQRLELTDDVLAPLNLLRELIPQSESVNANTVTRVLKSIFAEIIGTAHAQDLTQKKGEKFDITASSLKIVKTIVDTRLAFYGGGGTVKAFSKYGKSIATSTIENAIWNASLKQVGLNKDEQHAFTIALNGLKCAADAQLIDRLNACLDTAAGTLQSVAELAKIYNEVQDDKDRIQALKEKLDEQAAMLGDYPPVVYIEPSILNKKHAPNEPFSLSAWVKDANEENGTLDIKWFFDDIEIGSQESITYQHPTDGVYNVRIEVTDSQGNLAQAQTVIEIGNANPVVTIATPVKRDFTCDELPVLFTGYAVDMEDGVLNSSAFSWKTSNDFGAEIETILDKSAAINFPCPEQPDTKETHWVILSANDSQGEEGAIFETITIANAEGELSIELTSGDGKFDEGESIAFAATVTFNEEEINQRGISWTSDIDGLIGYGSTLSDVQNKLTSGSHIITLRASKGALTKVIEFELEIIVEVPTTFFSVELGIESGLIRAVDLMSKEDLSDVEISGDPFSVSLPFGQTTFLNRSNSALDRENRRALFVLNGRRDDFGQPETYIRELNLDTGSVQTLATIDTSNNVQLSIDTVFYKAPYLYVPSMNWPKLFRFTPGSANYTEIPLTYDEVLYESFEGGAEENVSYVVDAKNNRIIYHEVIRVSGEFPNIVFRAMDLDTGEISILHTQTSDDFVAMRSPAGLYIIDNFLYVPFASSPLILKLNLDTWESTQTTVSWAEDTGEWSYTNPPTSAIMGGNIRNVSVDIDNKKLIYESRQEFIPSIQTRVNMLRELDLESGKLDVVQGNILRDPIRSNAQYILSNEN